MAVIRPFNALRPPPERAPQVAAVPYDVVNTAEARALAAGNRWSFLHVSRPEIDLPDGTPIYSDEVYAKAAANFAALKDQCPLQLEETPSLYIYRLKMGSHEQTGIVACCSVDEYDSDIIRKHERTRPDKEDDRTRHIRVLRAQTGPVFLTYRAQKTIDALVADALERNPPLYDFVANDDIHHTIWRVPTYDPLVAAFKDVPYLYIADGHHRAASASRERIWPDAARRRVGLLSWPLPLPHGRARALIEKLSRPIAFVEAKGPPRRPTAHEQTTA